jgi:hypothetical protein
VNPLFVDVDFCQRRKAGEDACGDTFLFSRCSDDGRTIAVLSDGLGSGVKANILSRMTAAMALRFAAADFEILRAAEVMMSALPVCRRRGIGYATFSIMVIRFSGDVRIVEMGNPPFLLIRDGRRVRVPYRSLFSPEWREREIRVSEFTMKQEDRIVLCSDGITEAGMGTEALPRGWGSDACARFIEETLVERPGISSRELSASVVQAARRREPDGRPLDDLTCAVGYCREPQRMLVVTGPPFHRERDAEIASRFNAFSGVRVICGGTTSEIISRELRLPLAMEPFGASSDLPPCWRMPGAELVTEGVFTLTRVAQILDRGPSDRTDASMRLVETMRHADVIEFLVGTGINEAHHDPTLPVDLDIRRNLVRRIAQQLEAKYGKRTTIQCV